MTLGRRGREPDSRGAGSAASDSFVEVEELPPQRVLARSRRRIRIADLLVVGAVALLLAAGVGALGGRPEPTPSGLVAVAPSVGPTASDPPVALETPSFPCIEVPENAVPAPILFVNGIDHIGRIELVELHGQPIPLPSLGESEPPEPIEVRSDVVTTLYAGGGACAVSWRIDLLDSDVSEPLAEIRNPTGDPAVALQNRWELAMFIYRGREFELSARLTFPDMTMVATWPIRILPFDLPTAELRLQDGASLPIATGCDVTLRFANGGVEPVAQCGDAIDSPPPVMLIEPGASLQLSFPDWDFASTAADFRISCGRLLDTRFFEESTDCASVGMLTRDVLTITPAFTSGITTLAIAACAGQQLKDAYNELCGTWYTTITFAE